MKKLTYTLLITFITVSAWSQSEPIFTFNLFNQMNFNPAVAGSKDVLDAGAIYRNQWWSGIDGAPRTANVYAHMPFAKQSSGIGLNMIHDKIGLDRVISIGLNYAYRIRFKKNNTLSLGLGGRFENAREDWTERNSAVNPGDSEIGNDADSRSTFNVGPGVYFYNRRLYIGASIPRMLANSLYNDRSQFGGDVNTVFFQGGVDLPLSKNVDLLPNVQVRYNPNAPFDLDLNLNLRFFDALMIGAAYRLDDSINGLVVYQLKNGLRLGVAMDFTVSELSNATTGSFEVMLGYTFPCETCIIKNLRYF